MALCPGVAQADSLPNVNYTYASQCIGIPGLRHSNGKDVYYVTNLFGKRAYIFFKKTAPEKLEPFLEKAYQRQEPVMLSGLFAVTRNNQLWLLADKTTGFDKAPAWFVARQKALEQARAQNRQQTEQRPSHEQLPQALRKDMSPEDLKAFDAFFTKPGKMPKTQ